MQSLSRAYVQPPRPVPEKPKSTTSRRTRIQGALRAAHELGLITDAEYGTAAMMASYVKDDFDRALCAVEVQRIARDRGRDERTIRRHIRALEKAGLVENRTAGNGLRGCFNGGTVVFGVCFERAYDRWDELCSDVNAKRLEESRLLSLRRAISFLRRRLRSTCEELQDMGVLEWLSTLPRRYQGLSPNELARLVEECERRLEALTEARRQAARAVAEIADVSEPAKTSQNDTPQSAEPDHRPVDKYSVGRPKMSDGPDRNDRPYTLTKKDNNERMISTTRRVDKAVRAAHASTSAPGNENRLNVAACLAAIPPEWREWIDIYRESGMDETSAFVLVAKQFFNRMGGSERAWLIAKSRAGDLIAAMLVLVAVANPVRCMDAWLLAMVHRAENQAVNWTTPFRFLARTSHLSPAMAAE